MKNTQIAIDNYVNNTYLISSFQNKLKYKVYVCKANYKHRGECKYSQFGFNNVITS